MKYISSILIILLTVISCKSDKKEEKTMKTPKELTEAELINKARKIHEDVITLDTHCDINVNNFTDSINYTQRLSSQVNLPKMKEGGLDVAWFIVYTGQDTLSKEGYKKAYENAMSKFNAIHKLTEKIAPNEIELAVTSDDVRRISKAGKKVAMIGIENGYPIGTDISNVKKFYDLGGRYMSLAHQGHSQLSDSNTGEKDSIWLHNGLSDLGRKVIAEMNKYGMLVDLSHPSKKANLEMIKLSKAPVIASHSSARALCNHSRNLDDEQLIAIKENGGVVQTVAFASYVNTDKAKTFSDFRNELSKKVMDSLGTKWLSWGDVRKLPDTEREKYYTVAKKARTIVEAKMATMKDVPKNVDVSDFVDHIDYLVKKIGINHVGISSDFDGGGGINGWNDASETFNVTLELVKRGYTEEQIKQLWSENLLRVLDKAQEVAKEIQAKS